MKRESSKKTQIGNRTFIYRKTERGWAIIVMPDRLQIDNYYHGVHIHPDRAELKIKDPEILKKIIIKHILEENKIDFEKLRKLIL